MKTKIFFSKVYCNIRLVTLILFIGFNSLSCKKILEIPPPANSITTGQVFKDSLNADAAISGLYTQLINNSTDISFGNGGIGVMTGLSADELISTIPITPLVQLQFNTLDSRNTSTYNQIWQYGYSEIYQANACIDGLNASTTLQTQTKNQLIYEAKAIRAFCYFYLINLFGDVPYITSTDFTTNKNAAKTPKIDIYRNILTDLTDAQKNLRKDYSISGGERTRMNRFIVTALLARVYLYMSDWNNAKIQSESLLNNGFFQLENNLDNVFLVNSKEAIFQLEINPKGGFGNATPEGYNLLPYFGNPPNYYLNPSLSNSFEPTDKRKAMWTDTGTFYGIFMTYATKYKVGQAQLVQNGPVTEYAMAIRLAEQYLIDAESSAHLGDFATAINDLNKLRNRAGLPNLSPSLKDVAVFNAITQERRVELFCEWGHRWLDLKRTGTVDSVMTKETPKKGGSSTWKSFQQLYPIPIIELEFDPNLKQNPGY